MPATLRTPDVEEIPPIGTFTRSQRLETFVTQRLAQNRERVSLIAWRSDKGKWAAWYDDTEPNKPRRNALVEATIDIAPPTPAAV